MAPDDQHRCLERTTGFEPERQERPVAGSRLGTFFTWIKPGRTSGAWCSAPDVRRSLPPLRSTWSAYRRAARGPAKKPLKNSSFHL